MLFQSIEAVYKEAFPPSETTSRRVFKRAPISSLVQSLGGEQNHLGALELKIR